MSHTALLHPKLVKCCIVQKNHGSNSLYVVGVVIMEVAECITVHQVSEVLTGLALNFREV